MFLEKDSRSAEALLLRPKLQIKRSLQAVLENFVEGVRRNTHSFGEPGVWLRLTEQEISKVNFSIYPIALVTSGICEATIRNVPMKIDHMIPGIPRITRWAACHRISSKYRLTYGHTELQATDSTTRPRFFIAGLSNEAFSAAAHSPH